MVAWLILAVVIAIFATVMAGLWREAVRPLNETDEFCSSIDGELDQASQAARSNETEPHEKEPRMVDPVVPTTVTLTTQERRIIYRALTYTSAALDHEGQAAKATIVLELAYRILPGGLRDLESAV